MENERAASNVILKYTNREGELWERLLRPLYIVFREGDHHEGVQWLLIARDLSEGGEREIEMKSVHSWMPAEGG